MEGFAESDLVFGVLPEGSEKNAYGESLAGAAG
jgi:hypothetical protein